VSGFPDEGWMRAVQRHVNDDRELALIGRWFSVDFSLSFGDRRYVISVRNGRFETFRLSPRFDVAVAFGMRAPLEVWEKFLSKDPPPRYHAIFAMVARVPEFVFEGDTLTAMQNVRALLRFMTLMQQVGGSHARV
jgi:hypothetical protein